MNRRLGQRKTPYQIGTRVTHIAQRKTGIIESIINPNDYGDSMIEGYRYEVRIGNWLWSIPHKYLTTVNPKSLNSTHESFNG